MKDGIYDLHFSALGVDHPGTLSVHGNLAAGECGDRVLTGQLSRAGAHMIASFEVARRTPQLDAAATPAPYTLRMFGSGTYTDFDIIGLAPLGLIVELRGTWRAEPGARSDDRDADGEHVPTDAAS